MSVNVQQKFLNRVLNRCDAIIGPSTLTVKMLRNAITVSPNISVILDSMLLYGWFWQGFQLQAGPTD